MVSLSTVLDIMVSTAGVEQELRGQGAGADHGQGAGAHHGKGDDAADHTIRKVSHRMYGHGMYPTVASSRITIRKVPMCPR